MPFAPAPISLCHCLLSCHNKIDMYLHPYDIGELSTDIQILCTNVSYFSVRPPLRDPHTSITYVTPAELLTSLTLLSIGVSSSLFIWEPASETFVLKDVPSELSAIIIVGGMDEKISHRYLSLIWHSSLFKDLGKLPRTHKDNRKCHAPFG